MRQAKIARAAERRATIVRDFLLDDMLRSANPWRSGRVTLNDLLRQAQANMDVTFEHDPETLELMRAVLGETWSGLGRNDMARPLLLGSLESSRGLGGDESATALAALVQLELDAQRPDLAAPFVFELMDHRPPSPHALWLAGRLASQRGAFGEARAHFEQAIASKSDLATSLFASVAENELRWGNYPAALDAITKSLDATEPQAVQRARLLVTRARIEIDTDDLDGASSDLSRAKKILTERLGTGHAALLPIRIIEAIVAFSTSELDRVITLATKIEDDLPQNNEAPQMHAQILSIRAATRMYLNDLDGALNDSNETLRLAEKTAGDEHPFFASMLLVRAPILEWRGTPDDAISDLERAAKIFAEHVSPMQAEFAETEMTLGSFLTKVGRPKDGLPHLERALRLFTTIHGKDRSTPSSPSTSWLSPSIELAICPTLEP